MSSLNTRAYWGYGEEFTKNPHNTAGMWSSHLSFRRPEQPTASADLFGTAHSSDATVSGVDGVYMHLSVFRSGGWLTHPLFDDKAHSRR